MKFTNANLGLFAVLFKFLAQVSIIVTLLVVLILDVKMAVTLLGLIF